LGVVVGLSVVVDELLVDMAVPGAGERAVAEESVEMVDDVLVYVA
jgi:hypothetical protein